MNTVLATSFFARRCSSSAIALFIFGASSCSSGGGSPVDGSGGSAGSGGSHAGTGGSAGASSAGSSGSSGGGGSAGSSGSSGGGGSAGGSGGHAGTGGSAAGSGDAGGMAGSSGGGSGSGGGPATDASTSPKTAWLSEDYENGTSGMQPAGWDNFIGYVKNNKNPQGETLALVDNTRAHGGKNSVHFHGGVTPAMLTRPLPANTNKLYVRAYFYMTRQLGMNPGANHETLLGIRGTSGSAGDEVRFGEIKGTIGTNEVPPDDITPKMSQWGMGPVVAANKWACIEVGFLADQPQHVLQAWADGTQVQAITMGDQWQNSVMPADWMKGKFTEFIVGWQSFSNATNDVWMDDLALSSERVGCL